MGIFIGKTSAFQNLRGADIPYTGGPVVAQRIAHIGDSTSWQAGAGPTDVPTALVAKGWKSENIFYYAKIGKPLWSADGTTQPGTDPNTSYTSAQNIDQARAFFNAEPDVWQINLGANNASSSDSTNTLQIGLLLNKLEEGYIPSGSSTRQYARKIQIFGVSQSDSLDATSLANRVRLNRAIRTITDRRTAIDTEWYDWHRVIKGYSDSGYWSGDGIHMNSTGYSIKNTELFGEAAGTPLDVAKVLRPTGADYVRWEDLYVSGDTFQAVTLKAAGKILTLPAGTFEFSNFANGGATNGVRLGTDSTINTACRGLVGTLDESGNKLTTIRMTANTSDKVPPTSTGSTNPYYLIHFWKQDRAVVKNLILEGTEQGHPYNGLRFSTCKSPTVDNVFFKGVNPGYANFPPGETFGVNMYVSDNAAIFRSEFDGRQNGVRVCASAFGWNTASNAYVRDVYEHDGRAGMGTFWETTNIHTVGLKHYRPAFSTNPENGQGINMEKVGGTIRHIRPDLIIDREGGNTGLHISLNNSTGATGSPAFGDATDVEIHDIKHDLTKNTNGTLLNAGCLSLQVSTNYHLPQGQTQTTMPTITKNGVTLTVKETSGSGFDPAVNFVVYR